MADAAVNQDPKILDLLLSNENKTEIDERNNDKDNIELRATAQKDVVNANSLDNSWAQISNPLKGAMDQLELIGNTSSGVQSTSD